MGSIGTSGNTAYDAATKTFSVSGAGSDIGLNWDSFQFAWAPATGDLTFATKILALSAPNTVTRAGLMLRENGEANSAFVGVFITGGGSAQMVSRPVLGQNATVTAGSAVTLPVYVKLRRANNIITAFYSNDGLQWSALGSTEVGWAATVRAGVAVSSKDRAQVATLRAEAPTLSSAVDVSTVSGLQLYDVGATNVAATASVDGSGKIALSGSGYMLPGTAREGLALLAKHNGAACAISTQVLPPRASAPLRSGVVMRETLADNGRFASLTLDDLGRVVFEYRTSPGNFAVSKTFGETTRHLLLDRNGSTITAMVSDDGLTWRSIAAIGLSFPTDPLVGLETVSVSPVTAVTADFDGFEVVNH